MKQNRLPLLKGIFLLFLSAIWSISHAQNREGISGSVKDTTGKPLSGVTITVPNAKEHAFTKEDGTYFINAPVGSHLKFSYIGFVTRETTSTSTILNVVLQQNASEINDVVVTALGIKKEKKMLGYAVSTINDSELVKAGATMNPFLALYGKAAGVGINIGASGPEGGLKINIRGAASLNPNQNVRPLFVVDGVIINDRSTSIGGSVGAGYDYGANINDINSEDIASITILKGAKATVLYGTDAANGVVLITTKSGKGSKGLGVSGFFQSTIEHPKNYLELQNEYGLGNDIYDTTYATVDGKQVRTVPNERFSFGPKFDGAPIMFSDSMMYKNVPHDGYNSLFKNGSSYTSNVAIAGSSDKGSLRASYTNYKYNDIISPNSWQKRNTFSFNGNIKASKFASFDLVTNLYDIVTQNRRESNAGSVAWGFPEDYNYQTMYRQLFLDSNGYQRDLSNYGVPQSLGNIGQYMWSLDKNRYKDDKFHIITSAKVTLNFSKHVFLVSQFGLDYDNTTYTTEESVTKILPTTANGSFGYIRENNSVQNYQSLLNYTNDFKGGNLHLNLYGGGVYVQRNYSSIGVNTVGGLRFPGWYSLNNQAGTLTNDVQGRSFARGSDVMYSALASGSLAWKSEIIFEAQARQDWNSTLPPGNNKYFYPGASITWNYTDRFHIPGMNSGQFRFSWADVGNGTARYFANNQYSLGYLSGLNDIDAITVTPPSNILPGVLKPEKKREFEVGINNSFFQGNRLVLDISFYTNNRYNQIISLPTSVASSSTGLLINAANMRSTGLEFQITGTPVLTKDIRWDITVNGANQQSKVLKLGYGLTNYAKENLINGSGAYIAANVGHPYGDIMMEDYTKDSKGERIVNSEGIYTLNEGNPVAKGNIMPKLYGGVLSDFNYKNFSFRIGLDYKYGGTIFSYTNERLTGLGQLKSTLKYRDAAHGGIPYYIDGNGKYIALPTGTTTAPAQSADGKVYYDGVILPGVMDDGNGNYAKNTIITSATNYYETYANDLATSFPPDALFKNDYIKVREVALTYDMPSSITKKLRVQKLTLTLAGRNLFYLYKSIPNIDVESALGADGYVENSVFPGQATYSLGLNVNF